MKVINNVTDTVRDDLAETLTKGSRLSVAAACFSIYAYQELRKQLDAVEEVRFIFTSPTFVAEKTPKSQREFYIPRLNRERSLYGTEFEIKLRNELTQRAIAKECAEWINKVKTALLIIQKDFENRYGFSPISVRPIPLFSVGYFEVAPETQAKLLRKYPNCLRELEPQLHICEINLEKIWRNNPECASSSFPQFKYLLYSKDPEFEFVTRYPMNPALCVSIEYAPDHQSTFESFWNALKAFINKVILSQVYVSVEDMVQALSESCGISKYKARAICEVIIASMDAYRRNYSRGSSTIVKEMATNEGKTKYLFNVAVNSYLTWVEKNYRTIIKETRDGQLYLVNDGGTLLKETSTVLGILEALDVLSFKMIGGANSQLYIYINQTRSLEDILNRPGHYQNRLLDAVSIRHLISVKMLTYIYEGNCTSEEIWDLLEDYFLGVIPEKVKRECRKENPNVII